MSSGGVLSSYTRPAFALIIREMSTTYGRSPAGFVWLILEPLGAILLMAIVFSYALRSPPLGDNFALFYASGYLPYMMYMEMQKRVSRSIRFSRALLKYPRVNFFDAIVARAALAFISVIFASILISFMIIYVTGASNVMNYKNLSISFLFAALLGVSVGCVNCALFTRVHFWEPIWNILNRPMFIISGVFFLFEAVPDSIKFYLWLNPVIHVVGLARTGFYASYDPTYISELYIIVVSIVLLMIGLIFLSVLSRDYIDE